MTKRHFVALAELIHTQDGTDRDRDEHAAFWADQCARQNPRFDRNRFLDACRPDPRPEEVIR